MSNSSELAAGPTRSDGADPGNRPGMALEDLSFEDSRHSSWTHFWERVRTFAAVKIAWKSPSRRLAAVKGFHATEADGVWHLRQYMKAVSDPEQRAHIFTHSLEEESHAAAFEKLYNAESSYRLNPSLYERQALYSPDEASWKPLAYVHVGEVDATERFRMLHRQLPPSPLRSSLETIIADEDGHVGSTEELVLASGASQVEATREYRAVRRRRAWEEWLRVGRHTVDRLVSLQLAAIYYLAGPLVTYSARKKLTSSAVSYDNNRIKSLAREIPSPGTDATRYTLGISFGYHDASACLVDRGQVIAAIAEERLTRQKHDPHFPHFAIQWCLDQANLKPNDVGQVVYHEDPFHKFSRVLTSSMAAFPHTRREFTNSMKSWVGKKLWSLNSIAYRLGLEPDKISYLSHHFSHGVQAFLGSGYRDASILVVDAVGDWASTALFKASWEDGPPKLERISEVAFPHSLGLVYSAFTAYLGFNPNDSECSTMALAAFGKPRYADDVREIISDVDEGLFSVDQRYFRFMSFYQGPVTEAFLAKFGPGRDARDPLPFSCLNEEGVVSTGHQRYADVAASLQLVLEERVLALCRDLYEKNPSENLCLAGGVSLNCVANYRILTEGPFKNVYIPPDPGDGGTCVGTALYADAHANRDRTPEQQSYRPYIGSSHEALAEIDMLAHIKPDHFLAYLDEHVDPIPGVKWRSKRYDDDATLCRAVAARIEQGEIVGWFQGRCELGPRALGNRSILARPDDCALAERISKKVKHRAAFRPYSFSIAAEDAEKVIDVDKDKHALLRWMQYAAPVFANEIHRLKAAVHVDNTCRVQVCSSSDNALYHELLREVGKVLGLAAVLNTSFNPSGYPVVETPDDALAMFARTDMDTVVLGKAVIWKEK